jgi:hypothetical protein
MGRLYGNSYGIRSDHGICGILHNYGLGAGRLISAQIGDLVGSADGLRAGFAVAFGSDEIE